MALSDDFRAILIRLNEGGWEPIFDALGLDIGAANLKDAVLRPVADIGSVNAIPGFEEVAPEARRPIEPGQPAKSLLFHALASPAVQAAPDGLAIAAYPTAAELETAENFVYAVAPPALDDLRARFPTENLAIGVFAREYRQRRGTVHGAHADMIYSRTGVTRVGTEEPFWDGPTRSYLPRIGDDNPHVFRVMPCRYGIYLAVQRSGDPSDFGPYKADRTIVASQRFNVHPQTQRRDRDQTFWVPVHKLFSGEECLRDRDLTIALDETHVNEKLRRIHLFNMGVPRSQFAPHSSFDSGFNAPEIEAPPFTVTSGLTMFLPEADHGAGALCAVVRPRFVEPTEINGTPIGTMVPAQSSAWGSFTISALANNAHKAPEWMHVRTRLKNDGTEQSLNGFEDVARLVEEGRVGSVSPYVARHYTDFTADGWVAPQVSGLPGTLDRKIPAYSLVAAPDFYPYVSQSDLMDWWLNVLPSALGNDIWQVPPLTLCDQRSAPNLDLRRHGAPFVGEDFTVSAMLGAAGSANATLAGSSAQVDRTSFMPDNAAGLYAPGWDTSVDFDTAEDTSFLAAHGLGSPFPEDAKLCAAISAFWPSVAPDTSRSYGRQPGTAWRIVAPMTDREVGLEDAPPWDGVPGPRQVDINGRPHIEDDDFAHVDYVRMALEGRFSMAETMNVTQEEYQARIVATRRMLNASIDGAGASGLLTHRLLSFRKTAIGDPELVAAEAEIGSALSAPTYRFVMVQTGAGRPLTRAADRERWLRRSQIDVAITILVDDFGRVVFSVDGGPWLAAVGS